MWGFSVASLWPPRLGWVHPGGPGIHHGCFDAGHPLCPILREFWGPRRTCSILCVRMAPPGQRIRAGGESELEGGGPGLSDRERSEARRTGTSRFPGRIQTGPFCLCVAQVPTWVPLSDHMICVECVLRILQVGKPRAPERNGWMTWPKSRGHREAGFCALTPKPVLPLPRQGFRESRALCVPSLPP